ncbi:hypothetical protein [Nocardioides litoris]|uniref:hypothetical protein n=1 Tax=Nocardioides litoris TaxID=1926648 RepID=UPI00111DB048|nr:hypothetical protein [Nocardioides litoris]
MTRAPGVRRRLASGTAGVVLLAVVATGCGSDDSAADRVPALGDQLARVDDALVAGRWGEARRALDDIEQTAADALADGDLTDTQADDVRSAVEALRAVLRQQRSGEQTSSPDPTSEPAPTEEPTDDETSEPAPEDTEEPEETEEPEAEEPDEPDRPDGPKDDQGPEDDKGPKDDKGPAGGPGGPGPG